MRLGDSVREARTARHMTVAGLARASGLSKGFISQVESGRSNPSIDSLDRIAESLGLTVAQLLTGRAAPFPPEASAPPRVRRESASGLTASGVAELEGAGDLHRGIAHLLPRGRVTSLSRTDARAFCLLIEGSLALVQDREEFILGSGDSVTWSLSRPFSLEARGTTAATLLIEMPGEMSSLLLDDALSAGRPPSRTTEGGAYADTGPLRLAELRARHARKGV